MNRSSANARVVLAGTGHRPDKLGEDAYAPRSPIQDWVRREVRKVFAKVKPDVVISGMALGFDQWLAMEALECKIPLHAYIPFEGQESRWWGESKVLYAELLSKAALVRTICSPGYAPWKMQRRNEAMVDACTLLLSLYDGSLDGGTFNCIEYAESVNRKRINIDPVRGLDFIAKKQAAMFAKTLYGGYYDYVGNLKWKYFPPAKKSEFAARRPDEDEIPF